MVTNRRKAQSFTLSIETTKTRRRLSSLWEDVTCAKGRMPSKDCPNLGSLNSM
ncbi:hypothetical protein HAX54_032583, partial [Datura stramonium]|nr:hypothetical protein [Datura stramonium]